MSDSSDVEIISVSENLSNAPHKGTDEADFSNSSDDYEEDPQVSGLKAVKQARSELAKDKRNHLANVFDFLQEVVLNGQVSGEYWKRTTIVYKALKACQDLVAEEDKLKLELEILLQENWKLKKKIGRMSNRRKRKSGCTTLTRKVSNLSLNSPKLILPEKTNIPMDETPAEVKTATEHLPVLPTPTEVKPEEMKKTKVNPRQLRRRYKKHTGLSEEEKEFHMLKEKIEDITFEVDSLWNEVKDEDELENNEGSSLANKDANEDQKAESSKEDSPEGSQNATKSTSLSSSGLPLNNQAKRSLISVADITKLMAPQFVQKQLKNSSTTDGSKSSFGFTSNADDSSDDENPRLVIDEGDSPKNSDHEADTLEALQAVGAICRNLIADKTSKEVTSRVVKPVDIRKKRITNNSDGSQSDSSVIVIE